MISKKNLTKRFSKLALEEIKEAPENLPTTGKQPNKQGSGKKVTPTVQNRLKDTPEAKAARKENPKQAQRHA